MSFADKFRRIQGKLIQDGAGHAAFMSDGVDLKTAQSHDKLERVTSANISVDELKQLAEHYGKQLLNFLDEIESVVERKSNSKIELIADFIKVVQNADQILEFPAIEKLVKDAAKSVEE